LLKHSDIGPQTEPKWPWSWFIAQNAATLQQLRDIAAAAFIVYRREINRVTHIQEGHIMISEVNILPDHFRPKGELKGTKNCPNCKL